MIPTFSTPSFTQSNNTLPSSLPTTNPPSNGSIPDESNDDALIENDTSFASLSRSLAETNQAGEEQTPSSPPSAEPETNGETNQEEDIQ